MENTKSHILHVKATPKASENKISGWTDSEPRELSVRVCAPAEKGKSNEAICKLIASSVGISKSRVKIVRGKSSRHKQIAIDIDSETYEEWISGLEGSKG